MICWACLSRPQRFHFMGFTRNWSYPGARWYFPEPSTASTSSLKKSWAQFCCSSVTLETSLGTSASLSLFFCVSVPVHLYKNGPRLQELSWKKSRDSPSTAEISFFKTSHENRLLFVPKRFLDSGTWCQSPLHHQHLPDQSGKALHFVNHRCLP